MALKNTNFNYFNAFIYAKQGQDNGFIPIKNKAIPLKYKLTNEQIINVAKLRTNLP